MTLPSTIILGGGPGGTGALIWAAQTGVLDAWLEQGVVLVESQAQLGGSLGRYAINSDTLGSAYLECLDAANAHAFLRRMRTDPVTQEMQQYRDGFPPLSLVGRFMARLGGGLAELLSRHPRCAVLTGTTARAISVMPDGSIKVKAVDRSGRRGKLHAHSLVMALGASHAVMPPPSLHPNILPSDRILTAPGLCEAVDILRRAPHSRVAILGGSHSAYSVAWALTHLLGEEAVPGLEIVMLSRQEPPVFYRDMTAAAADGYPVRPGDVCPRTGRVNRLGGLRGNGRDVWRQLRHAPASLPIRRQNMAGLSAEAVQNLLADAALVIPAFGYRSRHLPVFTHTGLRIPLRTDVSLPAVDAACRIYRADGNVLPNVFGIGLGTGFRPTEAMGGEPNFTGQANSLWLYQNDIGATVFRGVQQAVKEVQQTSTRPASVPMLGEVMAFG